VTRLKKKKKGNLVGEDALAPRALEVLVRVLLRETLGFRLQVSGKRERERSFVRG